MTDIHILYVAWEIKRSSDTLYFKNSSGHPVAFLDAVTLNILTAGVGMGPMLL